MQKVLAVALLGSLLGGRARAAGLSEPSGRAPLATTNVERGLVLDEGWLEFDVGADYKRTDGYWTGEGASATFPDAGDGGASWMYSTERLGVRFGVARHLELDLTLPLHYVRLGEATPDSNTFGLGDPTVGWRVEWLRKHAPTASVATDLVIKVPVGSQPLDSHIGAYDSGSSFPLSTGTPDVSLELAGKEQLGPLSLTGALRGTHRFSGAIHYLVDTEDQQFRGRFKPGDEVRIRLAPELQLGPLALAAELSYTARDAAAAGTSATDRTPDRDLSIISGSDGWALSLMPALTANVTRGVDVQAAVNVPLRGEDVTFFPLEELTPTRGLTYSATLELRR